MLTNTYFEVKPGKHYIIGTEATVLEVTESFKLLGDHQRNCTLESIPQINCYFQALTRYGIQTCNCMPWYMKPGNNVTEEVCIGEQFLCFEDAIRNQRIQKEMIEKCLPSCSYIKYKSILLKEETLDSNNLDYEEVQADVVGSFLERAYAEYWSYVQINFADPHATVITQDAKVTFADQLGSIGGTFGIFLGLSFVGLLDQIVDILQFTYRILNKKKLI